jgi:hypothetical protein
LIAVVESVERQVVVEVGVPLQCVGFRVRGEDDGNKKGIGNGNRRNMGDESNVRHF